MSKRTVYKTVKSVSESMIVEKKSKFIASVFPVSDESEALAHLNEVKKKFPDATHHVYAYIIDENNIFRYSDDGEPSGTAGMPVLDVLRNEEIVDVLVVVTRYFGGTLLGTGGLVRAYSQSAKTGIEKSTVIVNTLCNVVNVRVDYSQLGKFNHFISKSDYILTDTLYDDYVSFVLCIKINDLEKAMDEFTDLSNGTAKITFSEQKYLGITD